MGARETFYFFLWTKDSEEVFSVDNINRNLAVYSSQLLPFCSLANTASSKVIFQITIIDILTTTKDHLVVFKLKRVL